MFVSSEKALLYLAVLVASLLIITAAPAWAIDWSGGGGNSDWSNGANWVGGIAPGTGDDAVFPISATVTNAGPTVGSIQVTSGATVDIQTVSGGGSLTIDGGTAGAQEGLAQSITVTGGSSLTFSGNFTVSVAAGQHQETTVDAGSSLTVNGPYAVDVADGGFVSIIYSVPTGSLTFDGGWQLTGQVALASTAPAGSRIPMTINNGIRFMAHGCGVFCFSRLTSTFQNPAIYAISLDGNLDASALVDGNLLALELLLCELTITGSTTVSGPTDSYTSSTGGQSFFGNLMVTSGATFRIATGLYDTFRANFWNIKNDGTADFGDAPLNFGGTIFNEDGFVENNGTWNTTGDIVAPGIVLAADTVADPNNTPDLANEQQIFFRGDVTIGGNIDFSILTWLVDHGGSLTVEGNANVEVNFFDDGNGVGNNITLDNDNLPILGVNEDGATVSGRGTITINGNLDTSTGARADMYALGEGTHNFAGDVTFTGADNMVTRPDPANDQEAIVNFTGTTQALGFSANGSYWLISSAAGGTRITQTGKLILIGDLNLDGASGGTAFSSTGAASVEVGDGTFGVTGTIGTGDGDVTIDTLTVLETQLAADATEHSVITCTSTGSGTFTVGTFTIQGDTNDDNGAGVDQGGGEVIFDAFNVTITTSLNLGAGMSGFQGFGASLTAQNGSTISLPGGAQFNTSTAPGVANEPDGGAKFTMTGSTITLDTSSSISFGNESTTDISTSTINGAGSWTVTVSQTAASVTLLNNTSIGADGAGGMTLTLAGDSISVIGNAFSNYVAAGVNIANGSLTALNQNTFQNGQPNGTHLTMNSLSNADMNADSNEFDDSTTIAPAGSGQLVSHTTGNAAVTFRHGGDDHGLGAYNIDSATAEADGDNDGTTATEIRWSTAPETNVSAPGSQPNSGGFITDSGDYAILAFTVGAVGGDTTITGFSFDFSFTGNMTMADLSTLTLYHDVNGNGDYDSGTDTAVPGASLSATIPNPAAMTGLNEVISDGNSVDYVLVVNFAGSGAGGTMTVTLPAGGITAGGNIVNGLPVSNSISGISGPATQLVITTQPFDGGPSREFVQQPVLELRDANGLVVSADNSTTVTASFETPVGGGGASLLGTNPVTAVNGVFTFTDLAIDQQGSYTLRFTTSPGGLFVVSGTVDVTLDGGVGGGAGSSLGGGGGGCAATGGNAPILPLLALMVLALLGLRAVRRI